MNESERSELEWVKQRHSRLEQELAVLSRQLRTLEGRLQNAAPETPKATERVETAPRPAAVPPPIPPIIAETVRPASPAAPIASAPRPEPVRAAPEEKVIRCSCKHCGEHIEFPAVSVGDTVPCPHCGQTTFLAMETRPEIRPETAFSPGIAPPPPSRPPTVPQFQPASEGERSFEMRLGTYWLVRIGIVMLLTGLVFFGNYAYQNFIVRIGPVAKVILLYIASGILLGAGSWWQRKAAKEALRNYAQVLFAGGLAAVYFTTYAAHYLPNLQVITSRLLDGILLFAWTGFMVWIADRKKSEVLALFAILLAYYTSVMTRVGSFTLYSNLLLTIAAVFFLVRNRWAALSFASLVATYAAYGFWRFFDGSNWQLAPAEGLWHGAYFLIAYWVIFTAAVFLSRHDRFAGINRATFLTLNNVQFFLMFLLTMLQMREGGFWKFCLWFGAALLVLAELARRFLASEPFAKNSYLIQGLLLVTVGIISKFSGLQLALLLGAESILLATVGTMRKSIILQVGAYVAGALAVGWGIDGLDEPHGKLLQISIGAFMAFNAFWAHRFEPKENQRLIRAVPAYYTVLAMISWLATASYHARAENLPLVLASGALALTASVYVLRVREFAVFGQGYLVLAHAAWLIRFGSPEIPPPWWNPALLIAITLALSHWWQKQRVLSSRPMSTFWQGVYALALIAVVYLWLRPLNSDVHWLAVTSALAVGITAYGVFTRAWLLAAFGQFFIAFGVMQFALQLGSGGQSPWHFPLAPVAALVLMSFATMDWFRRRPSADAAIREPLLQIALLYRWAALVMSLWWIQEYIPAQERIWVLAALGLFAFLIAGWRKSSEALLFSAGFTVFGMAMYWVPLHVTSTVYLPNLFAILVLLAQQRLARRLPERFPVPASAQTAMIALGGMSVWLFLSRWLFEIDRQSYLTPVWAALALVLFVFGMTVRERVFRWLGLAILACALGRAFVVDVWKLQELYRILSFVALGIVLLVLGFIYSKYQEKIKEWL